MNSDSNLWFNSNWFASIVGAAVGFIFSLTILFVTNKINNKNQEKNDKRNLLIILTQSYSKLFYIIYQGSLDKSKIDYNGLRTELRNSNLIWVLNGELRESFLELYRIYNQTGTDFENQQGKIYNCLVGIVNELNKCGADIFGDKQ